MTKIKVSEATGNKLNWLVAKCLGFSKLGDDVEVPDELAPTCPHCFRTLEDKPELDSGLCTSDDCPRHDAPEELM